MIYLELYFSFVKIGFTSFGGMSMIPLILEEMTAHHWMTAADLSNLVGIAEMTPGPLGMNSATFVGTRTAGFLGGLSALLGVLTPTLTLTLAAAIFYAKVKNSKLMGSIMQFIKPICIGMLLNVLISLLIQNQQEGRGLVSPPGFLIIAIGFYLTRHRNWNVPSVILVSALIGMIGFGVLPF